ncbi:MAG: ACP S-malonyltransferase [Clostridium sp.]
MSGKIAFLFSGQGAQYVGMGKDLYENIEACREVFDRGEEVLNMGIKDIIFNGQSETLMETENAQPAILLTSLAALKALEKEGITADYATGLSLGEYAALIYGGALSFEDGVALIKERGRIMGSALPKGLGKMAAILKLNEEKFEELLKRGREFGIVEGANYNCPGQVVIAGENEAVEECVKIAKELGGMGVLLNVSGPFHSSLLKEAGDEFYKTLLTAKINPFTKNIYSNLKGSLYENEDNILEILRDHISNSVYFEKIVRDMIGNGVDTFIEIGPGKALSGFVKKIDRKAKVFNVESLETLNKAIEGLKQ